MTRENQTGNEGRLRVVMSSFACEPGRGSEQEVGWQWASEMSRHVDVTVLTQTRNRPGIERWIERELPDGPGFEIEYLQFPGVLYQLKSKFDFLTLPYYACWQLLALKRAKALHRRNPFDLAHHVTFATFRIPIWLKCLGLPVVFGPVGGAETASWRLLAYRVSAGAWLREALRNIATICGGQMLRFLRPVRKGRGVCLAATPGMERMFLSRGFDCRLFSTIGVHLGKHGAGKPPAKCARRFLFVGRMHPLKGVQLLISAFAKVEVGDAELTIIGPGDSESGLRQLAEELGVGERVHWLGKVPREELAEYYESHDVLVAPSLYESGGMAVLEAMEHGRPAIVLAVGGHALSVDESCGARLSPKGSAEQVVGRIADAMEQYAITPGLVEAHGKAARQRILQDYSWPKKADRMHGIYQGVLGQQNLG